MFEIDPSHYRNFIFGIISKKNLARRKWHTFTLWNEELILFWNNGDVRCYKNYCPHYGLPLDQGKLTNAHIQCGLHGWKFQLSDGKFVSAPYTKKSPNCGLVGYKAFVEQGMIFVYTGDEEYFETAKGYTIGNVLEDQMSVHIEYEVPFYLALCSGLDYSHFPFHTFFFQVYRIYRWVSFNKNPMLSPYTPTLVEETDAYFKYVIEETGSEITVYPFCINHLDRKSSTEWQTFISPISETKSIYLNTLKSDSSSWIYRMLCYLGFHTIVISALREDKKWVKSMYPNFKKGRNINLCDHDFHLKKYLSKFITQPKSKSKNRSDQKNLLFSGR